MRINDKFKLYVSLSLGIQFGLQQWEVSILFVFYLVMMNEILVDCIKGVKLYLLE